MYAVTERNKDKIPYTTKDGVFDDRSSSDEINWWINGFWGGIMRQFFIPASNEPSAVLARAFGECREGQYPTALQRCKFDAPLLAAGLLTPVFVLFVFLQRYFVEGVATSGLKG